MKSKKRILIAFLLVIIFFVAHTFISTGYFRTIEDKFEGAILKKINIKGAEDISINKVDSFAIISATSRNFFPNNKKEKGNLYLIDLKNTDFTPVNLTQNFKKDFAPHGISLFRKDTTTYIAVINHTKENEFIELFSLNNNVLKHKKTFQNKLIKSPNDIVLINEKEFYFTNDHKYKNGFGRLAEDYLGLSLSNVIYFDGTHFKEVSDGIAYANGINYDSNRNLLFVASPRKFLVKVFEKNMDGSLTFIEDIDCNTGVDNIEFDENQNLWIGAHPNLLHFASYAKGKEKYSPSEIIKINYKSKGNYTIDQIYLNDGKQMSASTVAAPFNNLIFTGNVMDNHFLILKN